jgi:hypothetical protein
MSRRLFRKAVQQGRSERRGESYSRPYVEPLSVARTPLADFVNSLLGGSKGSSALLDMLPHLDRQGLFSKPKLIGLLPDYPQSSYMDSTELPDSFL